MPAVVATLWPVTDRTATAFSGAFYAALAEGQDAAHALKTAQMALRSTRETAYPGAWASFVLAGDGGGVFVIERKSGGPGWWWLVLVLALSGGAVWAIRFRAG